MTKLCSRANLTHPVSALVRPQLARLCAVAFLEDPGRTFVGAKLEAKLEEASSANRSASSFNRSRRSAGAWAAHQHQRQQVRGAKSKQSRW